MAKTYFRQAIDRDPTFARAYAGLGDATFIRAFSVNPDAGFDEAQQAIAALRRAVALDSGLAEGYAGLGYALTFANWEWRKADSAFKRAIALDPTYAPTRYWRAQLLALLGSKDSALAEVREAVNLDPLSAVANFTRGAVAISFGRYDEGLAALERAVELQPTYSIPNWSMAVEYARRGEGPKAEAAMRRFFTLVSGGVAPDDALIRDAVVAFINHRDPKHTVARLVATRTIQGNSAAAWAFAVAGERDSAFAWFDKAVAAHSVQLVAGLGNAEPFLRGDPRWAALTMRIGVVR